MPRRAKNPDTPAFTGKYYLTNATLLPEVIKCKKDGKISNELAKMLLLLTERYSKKSSFGSYTFREDMVSEALINLCKNALQFNPEKSSNPFAFYTTAIHRSFLQFLNNEKKHRNIRDKMLIELGENPSFNYKPEESERKMSSDNVDDISDTDSSVISEISTIADEIVEATDRQAKLAEQAELDRLEEEAAALALLEAGGTIEETEIISDEDEDEDEAPKSRNKKLTKVSKGDIIKKSATKNEKPVASDYFTFD